MILDTVSADDMRLAQVVSGLTMAVWIGVGFVPALRNHAYLVRAITGILYFLACLGFIVYAVIG